MKMDENSDEAKREKSTDDCTTQILRNLPRQGT
jgi:hypothetical protein